MSQQLEPTRGSTECTRDAGFPPTIPSTALILSTAIVALVVLSCVVLMLAGMQAVAALAAVSGASALGLRVAARILGVGQQNRGDHG